MDNVNDAEMSIFVITYPMVVVIVAEGVIASHDAAVGVQVLNHLLPLPPANDTQRCQAREDAAPETMIPLAFDPSQVWMRVDRPRD